MQNILGHRFSDVLGSLSKIFTVQPSSKYEELVSHSSRELNLKAWAKTAEQMNAAVKAFEGLEPRVVDTVNLFYKLSHEQRCEYGKFRELERKLSEFERASRVFEGRVSELGRLGDAECRLEHGGGAKSGAAVE